MGPNFRSTYDYTAQQCWINFSFRWPQNSMKLHQQPMRSIFTILLLMPGKNHPVSS